MEYLDRAELYIKDLMLFPLNIAVKEINTELKTIDELPNPILMLTGGQAIENYFPNNPYLRTHDFDLKLVAPTSVVMTPNLRRTMLIYGEIIINNLRDRMNMYIKPILNSVKSKLNDVELYTEEDGPFFVTHGGTSLWSVMFTMKYNDIIRQSPLIDVYVVKPSDVYHYRTFTRLQGSDPILSEKEEGDYYIPYKLVDNVPIADLGYVLWDTLRLIDDFKSRGLLKYKRYENKRDAIIAGLNNINTDLSCNFIKDYVKKCSRDFERSCRIGSKVYNNIDDIITYSIMEGIIPNDPRIIKRIRTYSLDYLCNKIKSIQKN
uniref:Uncharacterized protein n=1 Tax=Pithovirus LCPAC302 TaxID=2506593 RepID=A0A481Z671_9VIRU|nr:MAG: hypothetical protein LCPAC302_00030 [Pithovirus LCPAC302]